MTIRKYTAADQDAVMQLLRLNTPGYFAVEEEKDLLYYLAHHSANYLVVETEAGVIGCGGYNFMDDPGVCRISWDIFHPAQQGKGIGSKLVAYRIEQIGRNSNIQCIEVRTTQLVFKFYEKSGFVLKETAKDYWAPGFDLYRMELLLS